MSHGRFEELAQHRVPGEGPMDAQPLAPGLVNESCRVTRAGRAYSLRIGVPDAPDLGLDRRWECAVRAVAGAAGLAPAVRCCDPDDGILIADWATGRAWSAEETRSPENIEVMAQLLRRVHALECPRPARCMAPATWIAHYRAALARRGPGAAAAPSRSAELALEPDSARAAETHLANLEQCPVSAVLCHSDLHRLNLLIGDHPVLLDWEYAHVSDGFWDLAGWVANNDWTPVEAGRLLAAYLQRPVGAADLERLQTWEWLYDYVCLLWSALYSGRRPGTQDDEVAARAEILAVRLGSRRLA